MRTTSRQTERGQTLVLFLFVLVALLGITALVLDVGLAFNEKAALQSDVDAAALAGASALPDADAAKVLAADYAERNGLDPDDVKLTYTTPYKGDSTRIEVVAEINRTLFLAKVVGKDSVDIRARAVASMTKGSGVDAAFLALSPNMCRSFDKSGSSDLIINGPGGIVANSSCTPSINRTGGGDVSAAAINYVDGSGYNETGSGSLSPTPESVGEPIADPLTSMVAPDFTALGISPDSGGTAAAPSTKSINSSTTLHPGVYYGGIEIRSSADVTFEPGTYVIAGGGFKISGSGTITGTHVTFYNSFDPQKSTGAGACGAIDLGGSAKVTFTAPISGVYKSIGVWQDKACTNEMSIAGGQGGSTGVIYAPTANVKFVGSGNLGSIQAIANSFNVAGTGNLVVNFVPFIDIPLTGGLKLDE